MNLTETALALGLAQAFDLRTVGEADVMAWHSVLADAPADDVMEAIRRHYAEHTDRIMPAHIRRIVRDIERERQAPRWAAGQAGVPHDEPLPQITGRIEEGDVAAQMRELIRELLAERFPDASREKLMPRQVYWEREHRAHVRPQVPNPHYRPRRVCRGAVCTAEPCVLRDGGECPGA